MRIGVLGLGSIGMRHAENLLGLREDVLGYDRNAERSALFVQKGGKLANNREQLFESVQAIVICTPNSQHLEDLNNAVEKGLPVLMEKPLSHDLKGLNEVIQKAQKNNILIAPAMNLRFHDSVKAAHKYITNGNLGQVLWARFLCSSYLPNWRPHQDYRTGYTADPETGGVLFDIIHEFDLAYHLLGPMKVNGCHAAKGILEMKSEQIAQTILSHDNGAISTIHVDYTSPHKPQRFFEIHGQDGFLKGDLLARKFQVWKNNTLIEDTKFEGGFSEDYIAEMKNFLAAVKGQQTYICPVTQAHDVLSVVMDARDLAHLPGSKL